MQLTRCSTSIEKVFVTVNSNPTATINAVNLAVTGDEITFDGSGSNDPDSDGLSYTWDFGDGQGGQSEATASHAYAQGGTYTVQLTVDDNKGTECSKDITTMNVTINTPPTAVINAVNVACAGGEVSFDGSGSSDLDGDVLTYTWDFGDGTDKQSGPNVTHVYNNGGTYTVSLTVNDNKGTDRSTDTTSMNITINTPPSAVLSTVSLACTGDEISFDASGSSDADGDPLSYTWDFGDGSSGASGSHVTHVYSKGGSYAVKLSIDDDKGTVCSSDLTDTKVRINTPPVADAGPNHVCCLDAVSDFDGSGSFDADGDSLSYSWDFGDGNTGEGAKVNHVYSKQGTYTVTLTVNDNSGTKCDSSSDSFTAVVNAKPTSIIKVR